MLEELDECWEASSRIGTESPSKSGVSNAFATAAKVRGNSLFAHLVLVLVEIIVSDM